MYKHVLNNLTYMMFPEKLETNLSMQLIDLHLYEEAQSVLSH